MGRNYHDEPWFVSEAEAEKIHRLFATIAARDAEIERLRKTLETYSEIVRLKEPTT